MTTTTTPQLRVLFFDVFGTCVAQRKPVADELWKAAREALGSDGSSISSEVRNKATNMSYDQWFEFGGEWNKDVDEFVSDSIANHSSVQWRAVDKYRLESLHKLLSRRGLIILREDNTTSELHVKEGSLWDESQLDHLGHAILYWLSNTYNDLLEYLVAHSSIPFTHIYTADMFKSFKPNPKVYLGAAEKMGVKPEECGLVAAHLFDLKAAKACGFYTIYVERPLEEKAPELKEENIPDLWIKEDEGGFIALVERLGIQVG